MYSVIHDFWMSVDTPRHLVKIFTVLTHIGVALIISSLVYLLFRRVISPLVTRLVLYTKMVWDDIMFSPSVLKAISFLVFAYVLNAIFPPACRAYHWLFIIVTKLCPILLVVGWVRLVNRVLMASYELLGHNQKVRMQPIKGLLQMLQLICIIVGIIISVSILINKNPGIILTSLGASAAVLMLVFKDTILGVVAGVQLSANDMLRKGDWIVVPNTDVNGVVQDVSLTTVKVQNFDNTIVTVPPYNLVSGSFQNWRGMDASGGRRIMRSVLIDVRSVRFLTPEETARFAGEEWYKKATDGIDSQLVNLTAFRYYMEQFIASYRFTVPNFTMMVRQLQPTNEGIPMQVYCFVNRTEWVSYEHIQADIFDHIYAVVGNFGLSIYQAPSSDDLRGLADSIAPRKQPSLNA